MKRIRNRWVTITGALLASVAVGGCGGSDETAGSTRATIILPYIESIQLYPFTLARDLGYFREEGLDVEVQGNQSGALGEQLVAAGKLEFGLAAPLDKPLLAYQKSPTFTAVYGFYSVTKTNLYVPEDSPVQSVADLRGKAVGVPDNTGGEVAFARVAIAAKGLDPGTDVQLKVVGGDVATPVNALDQGRIDAFSSFTSSKVAADTAGYPLRCITCEDAIQLGGSVIVNNTFLKAHPDLVEGFGRALAKATVFGEANPQAALEIMKKANPEEHTDPEFAEAFMKNSIDEIQPTKDNLYGYQRMDAWQEHMNIVLNPATESGLTEAVDLGQLVTNRFVQAYNEFDHDEVAEQARKYQK